MTREEANRILRREIECLSHSKCEDCILEQVCEPLLKEPSDLQYIELFEMAIKALEQQDRIIQIIDDYDLEAWEILEKIKGVMKE